MPYHDTLGLRSSDRDRATPGYTVFSPLGQKNTYIINMSGEVVHKWDLPNNPGNYGYLLPNGNLFVATKTDGHVQGLAAKGGRLTEYDWDGKVVWEFIDDSQHHDFRRLPNGNTVYLGRAVMDEASAARVQGGVPGSEHELGIIEDYVREVDPDGQTVWEWYSSKNQDIEKYPIGLVNHREEFGHANCVFPVGNGDYLVNWRTTELIAIIDRETKAFKWELSDQSFGQAHDVQILDNGNILLFANGANALIGGPDVGSRIIELDPKTKSIVWQYKAKPGFTFFSWFISGCQRLPSGNTLICQGVWGRLFEVTPDGDVVWEYINPYFVPDGAHPGYQNGNYVFRCYRYAAESPQIAGRLPADPW